MTGGVTDLKLPNCTLYKRARYQFHEKKKNVTILLVGNPGTGKSETGIKICKDLDPTFDKTRIVNSVRELVSIIHNQKLKPGAAILFDEIAGSEEAADSRRSLSKANTTLSYISTISRVKRLIVIYCCPYLTQMDKRIRLIGVTAIIETRDVDFNKKLCQSVLYWVHSSGKTGKQYTPKPRVMMHGVPYVLQTVWWRQANKELLEEYKKIKNKFVDDSFEKWDANLNQPGKSKQSLNELYEQAKTRATEFISDKKISLFAIMTKLNATRSQAEAIKTTLRMDILKGRTIVPSTALNEVIEI